MWAMRLVLLLLLTLTPFHVEAQDPSRSADGSKQQAVKPGQIDALVAPIALYPDDLLAQVLMASTYPLEVVQAERWVTKNKNLQGDQLKKEAEKQGWDDSVKSLVATPSVLTMMSSKLDWTQRLGDAVLAQQADVMDAIQRLRTKAHADNKLQTTKEQKVAVRQENNRQIIAIESANPGTVFVPYYDPAVVYGEWPYPEYPPYYWYPEPGYIASGVIATGLAFGGAYALGRWATGGRWWGGNVNWDRGDININRGAHVEHWRHDARHRRGVAYNNAGVRQKFAGNAVRPGNKGQLDFRGRDGQQVLKSGDRAKTGDYRPANRPKTGDRGGPKQAGQAKQRSAQAKQRSVQASRPSQQRATRNTASHRVAHQQRHRTAAPRGGSRVGGRSYGYGGRSMGGSRAGGRSFGGRGGGGRGGGGRRSDVRLKHDVHLLGRLDNGLGFYRFSYNGSTRVYVGVMAQEVQAIAPEAVVRGRDGYLRVRYETLGLQFQTYHEWTASGAQIPRPSLTPPGPRNAVHTKQ
jgi:Protein of unknown function (DUF3300)